MKDHEKLNGTGRELPGTDQIRDALSRERRREGASSARRSTLVIVIIIIGVFVIAQTLTLPILRIYGQSMEETLKAGDIVLSVKTSDIEKGDIIAFYYNNSVQVKRVIAQAGEWVDIDQSGYVSVNGEQIDEPYVSVRSYGEDTNITLPYQVPEGRLFVLGDSRAVAIDSRNTAIGCVAQEQIVGKIVFRIWPLDKIGTLQG